MKRALPETNPKVSGTLTRRILITRYLRKRKRRVMDRPLTKETPSWCKRVLLNS